MFVLNRFVDDRLKHLNDQVEQHMCMAERLAVLSVQFTEAVEHPQAFHYFALHNHRCRVPVQLVPNVL